MSSKNTRVTRILGSVFGSALISCTANAATVLSDEIRLCAVGPKKVCDADMVLKDVKGNPALQLIVEAETSGADVPFPAPVILMSAPVAAYVASSVYMTEVQDGVVVASVDFGRHRPAWLCPFAKASIRT
jgi:hypothetical protein